MSELLGAQTDVLERNAESLSADARRVQDIRMLVQRAVVELQAGWSGSDLNHLTQQWEQQGSPLFAAVSASLESCAAQLRAQSAAQHRSSSSDFAGLGGSRATPMTMAPSAPPPNGASPAAAATWWRSLSPQQQQQVVREHPEWIGNRDGVSFTARDLANRALLIVDRDRLVAESEHLTAELKRLEPVLAGNWSGDVVTGEDLTPIRVGALGGVKEKLAALDAIEATLARPGERQLLQLDLGQQHALAAIANGNVGTADNVAVIVPGISTSVASSMMGLDKEMRQLQQRAQRESRRAHPTQPATTATVSWIGYKSPELTLDVLLPNRSVANDNMARNGAAQLTPFLLGIGAAREHDAHLTLLGHSYGSTTGGLALQQNTGVDDAVFFGSPGLGTSHLSELKLAPGHAYYLEASGDLVGDSGHFGIDPSHLDGVKHVSTREATVVDPASGQARHFEAVIGHSRYLDDGSTSQYNMSVIVAGEPDRRVHDNGEDLGDVFSWKMPETY